MRCRFWRRFEAIAGALVYKSKLTLKASLLFLNYLDQAFLPVMFTNQGMPNLSVSIPKVSPQGACSRGTVMELPTASFSNSPVTRPRFRR